MKKILFLLSFLLAVQMARADHHYNLSAGLSNQESHYFTATSYITLMPGFQAEPEYGCEVILSVDPLCILPPEEGEYGGPFSGDDGIVGTLGGTIDVSALGGAIYTIPIELPLGLGNLIPSLGICYNSQTRNNTLGWGWMLGGLSSINRTGCTLYHDGLVTSIDFENDRFCLDGQRLLKTSSTTYGGDGTTYRTELDQLCKIVSFQEDTLRGPAFFKVYDVDGKIRYYGKTKDSRVTLNKHDAVCQWLLSRIEDRYGNFIEYHYQNDTHGFYLTEICYSGNQEAQLDAQIRVAFNYEKRDDIEVTYIGDQCLVDDQLLTSIQILKQGMEASRYEFCYEKRNLEEGYPYPRLISITYHRGKQHYNPTRIQWGNNNYPIYSSASTLKHVKTNGVEDAFSNAVKFSGDFNGDGHTDVIATQQNKEGIYEKAYLFLNRGGNQTIEFDKIKTFDLSQGISWIYVADFDGDGCDDVLFNYRNRHIAPVPDEASAVIYLSKPHSDGTLSFKRYETEPWGIYNDQFESLLIGDFHGDGRQSILYHSIQNDKGGPISVIVTYDKVNDDFRLHILDDYIEARDVYAIDINGDGLSELMYRDRSSTLIATLRQEGDCWRLQTLPSNCTGLWDECFIGDYNGDGKHDILFYNGKASPQYRWFLSYGAGNELSTPRYLRDPFPYTELPNDRFNLDQPNETQRFIRTGDFDGNGCSDFVMRDDDGIHFIYGPFKEEDLHVVFENTLCINPQLFSFNSNMDLCIGNFIGTETTCFLGNHSISYLPPMTHRYEVKTILDGLGNKSEFQYDYLLPNPRNDNDENFYCRRSACTDMELDIYTTPLPLRALHRITSYNVSNKPQTIDYHYEGVLVHKRGKGILGFSLTRQRSYCNNILQNSIEKQYTTQTMGNLIHVTLESENIYDGHGNLMANSTPCYLPYTHEKNHQIFLPILLNTTLEHYDVDHPDRLIKKEITDYTYDYQCYTPYQYTIPRPVRVINGLTGSRAVHTADACEFQKIQTTEYEEDDRSNWIINKPETTVTTTHRAGNYDDISESRIFTYSSSKPYQLVSEKWIPNDGTQLNDPLTTKTSYVYDQFGHIVTQVVHAPNSTIPAQKTQYEYGKEYGYRLLTQEVNTIDEVTQYEYDPLYDNCISTTDCNGKVTRYQQDAFGSTCWTFHPDGRVECKATRWDKGIVIWEQQSGKGITLSHHAITGEETKTTRYDSQGNLIVSEIIYDELGRVKQQKFPHLEGVDENQVFYLYDPHNRVQQIKHGDGTYEDICYEGNTIRSTFYALDKEVETEEKTVNIAGWTIRSTDSEGTSVIYDHYPDGTIKSAQIEGVNQTRIEASYDHAGNQIMLNDPNYGRVTNIYDAYGRLCQRIAPKGDVTDYTYDELGRCIERTRTTSDGGQREVTSWEYGEGEGQHGLLKSIQHGTQRIDYQYDDYNRVIQVKDIRPDCCFKTVYRYDTISRVESITYPTGVSIHYRYDDNGIISNIYDEDGKCMWSTKEVTPMQQMKRYEMGNGIESAYTYDALTNRLIAIRSQVNGTKIQDYRYTYDDFANISSRQEYGSGQIFEEQFGYDKLNRLTHVSSPMGESRFTYDPLGRMTDKLSEGRCIFSEATYNGAQPHAIRSARTSEGTFPQERMDLTYTAFDNIASISEGSNGISFEYGYDDYRTRVVEDLDGRQRIKTYSSNCEFIQEDGGETFSRTFINGPAGIFAVVERQGDRQDIYYISKDNLGSWTMVTDSDGNILQECSYDVWGVERSGQHPMFDRGFTGHEHIPYFGLINMNGRLYDPTTSTMLSPDNNIQMPDFSQNLNRYTYCLNNPLLYTDPDGESFIADALFVYFMLCTNTGYEMQKYAFHAALHIDLHLSTEQKGIGFDFSTGIPKKSPFSYQIHMGATYYWGHYDDSFKGFEFRSGLEISVFSYLSYSTTMFSSRNTSQTTGALTAGSWLFGATYENDYMGFVGDIFMILPRADGGDRYRTAAAKIYFTELALGVNLFTGNPGVDHADRCTFNDPDAGGRETYCLNAKGDDPNEFRAGVFYFQAGPIKIGQNSEQIRNIFQNRFAHDFLCGGESPYFKILEREKEMYFYFGTCTGNTLW